MIASTAVRHDGSAFSLSDGEPPTSGEANGPAMQFLRASGLAQARLQVAILSGNRRRALEQIDRLVAIDRELERIGEGKPPAPCADLAEVRLALASEKLALTSGVELPRLAPAFGAGMGDALGPDEEVEVIEHEAVQGRLVRVLLWSLAFLALCAAVTAVVLTRL